MYFYQFVTIRLILIGNICIFCPWKDLPGLLTINIEDIDFAKTAKSFKPYFSRWSRFKDFLNLSTWGILFGQEKIGKKVITWRHMLHMICIRFWDGSTSNWLKISIMCQNSEMAHFYKPGSLRWLKIRTETKFEILVASNSEPSQSFRS